MMSDQSDYRAAVAALLREVAGLSSFAAHTIEPHESDTPWQYLNLIKSAVVRLGEQTEVLTLELASARKFHF